MGQRDIQIIMNESVRQIKNIFETMMSVRKQAGLCPSFIANVNQFNYIVSPIFPVYLVFRT